MSKKKLLLVVGSGASVEFGMPSVVGVRKIINAEAQKWYPLADTPTTNLYECIEKEVELRLGCPPNFEQVLYQICSLSATNAAQTNGSHQASIARTLEFPDVLFGEGMKQNVTENMLRQLGCTLVDALVSEFRQLCKQSVQSKVAEFKRMSKFVLALQDEFDIAVVTLNYDNVMYRAFADIETGFDPGDKLFRQERIFNRQNWPCMLHLHGSVHFDMRIRNENLHEIHWQPDINGTFEQNSSGRSGFQSTEGLDFPTSAIVAGYGKSVQLLRRPFRTYYSELDRLVANSDAVLFAGYGFGDMHLNMAFDNYRDSRRRPVVVIKYADDDAMTVNGASLGDDQSIDTILNTFSTDYASMRWLDHVCPDKVEDLKRAEAFETCCDRATPLSFWYNGMLSACDNANKVLTQLR